MEKDETLEVRSSNEQYYDQIESKVEEIAALIQSIPEDLDLRSYAASRFIFESMLWGSYNYYEALGLLESAKVDYIESFQQVKAEERLEQQAIQVDSKSKYTC
jgi:hypothetical protein